MEKTISPSSLKFLLKIFLIKYSQKISHFEMHTLPISKLHRQNTFLEN